MYTKQRSKLVSFLSCDIVWHTNTHAHAHTQKERKKERKKGRKKERKIERKKERKERISSFHQQPHQQKLVFIFVLHWPATQLRCIPPRQDTQTKTTTGHRKWTPSARGYVHALHNQHQQQQQQQQHNVQLQKVKCRRGRCFFLNLPNC